MDGWICSVEKMGVLIHVKVVNRIEGIIRGCVD